MATSWWGCCAATALSSCSPASGEPPAMSRRLSLRLVTARAVDEVPEGLADDASQVYDQPVTRVVGVGLGGAEQDAASRSAAGLGGDASGRRLPVTVRRSLTGGACAVSVDREILDRRRGPAEGALGIAPQPDLAEAHAERVVGQKPPDQRLADAEQQLYGLRRLNRSDHSWEHAQDTGLASGGDEARRRWCRVEAAVA